MIQGINDPRSNNKSCWSLCRPKIIWMVSFVEQCLLIVCFWLRTWLRGTCCWMNTLCARYHYSFAGNEPSYQDCFMSITCNRGLISKDKHFNTLDFAAAILFTWRRPAYWNFINDDAEGMDKQECVHTLVMWPAKLVHEGICVMFFFVLLSLLNFVWALTTTKERQGGLSHMLWFCFWLWRLVILACQWWWRTQTSMQPKAASYLSSGVHLRLENHLFLTALDLQHWPPDELLQDGNKKVDERHVSGCTWRGC